MPGTERKRNGARPAEPQAAPANPFVSLLSEVQGELEGRLDAYLAQRVRLASQLAPEVAVMVKALSELCRRGGKRLRPALVVLGYRAATRRRERSLALDAGVALELLQAYFLIHDDWMDGDATRRGGPSVHTVLTRSLGSAHKGAASAILAGDYAAALALDVLAGLAVPPRQALRVFAAFAEMQLAAVAGQQIDLVARARDIEAAYALKTGSYTVHGPLRLGALLGGGSARTLRSLEKVATPLGVGFQLRDDLLSAFGDPRRTGKALGNDLRAGKRTLLLREALKRARGADRALLERVVGSPSAKEPALRRALAVIDGCGARAAVEARIAALRSQALAAIDAGITRDGADLLRGAVAALTERRA
jgi:geranylgeranyl diphosphate synthase type I